MRFITLSRFRKLLMVYVIALLVISALFLATTLIPDIFNGYTVYWFKLHFLGLGWQLAFLVIPISTILIFALRFVPTLKTATHPLLVLALLAAGVIACCARLSGFTVITEHKSQIVTADHIYNALWEYSSWGGDDAFVQPVVTLYQCDQYNFLCKSLYQYSKDVEEPEKLQLNPWKIEILADSDAQTITLQINGEAVYVHPVK